MRLVYWCGGNPFHHHQDLNRLARAWRRPETVIVHESWWNPIARFADIVFPAATALERNDVAAGWADSWISAMHQAVEPPGRGAHRLRDALRAGRAARRSWTTFSEGRDGDEWVRHFYESTRENLRGEGVELPAYEEFWDAGRVEMPTPPLRRALDFAALRADPAAAPLPTPSGRIELASATIAGFGYDDCPGHPAWMEPAEWLGSELAARFPLHLISNQPYTRLHSQYDNGGYSQDSKVSGREPIRLHPDDARARGIADGDVVRVFNDRGSCLAGAVLDAEPAPLGRAALDGRLVGSRLAGRSERARPPRQPERAHARQGHLAPRAGARSRRRRSSSSSATTARCRRSRRTRRPS